MRGGVRLLGFSPDNRLLAAGSYDGTVLICDVGRD
jgi:WD40 repeat protein